MRPLASALIAILALTLWVPALADTYDTATLVNLIPPTKDDVQVLRDLRIDVVGVSAGAYKALVTQDQMKTLSAKGFGIEVLELEMQSDRARWAEAEASYAPVTSYYTPSKFNTTNPASGTLMEHLLQQYNAHPDVTRLYNLGPSQDGAYDIIAMKVTKNPDVAEAEPKIRIYANIHGDEKGGVMVSCDVLDTILAGYAAAPQDATARKLVDETEMWFIPIGNPYGNANSTRYNSTGTDCNRNFWGPSGSDAPPAWSQKETQAIRDLTEAATADHSKKRFTLSLSFHEGDTVFNSVWNYTTSAPSDEPIFWSSRTGGSGCGSQTIPNCPTIAPHGLAQAYKDGVTTPGFWYTEGYDWYGTRGDTNDWAYGVWTQLDTTIELNTQKTPAASQIPTYCAQHRQAVLNYMMKVFQGIHGIMTDQLTGAPLDGTVTATATASSTIPVPHAYQQIYTDPVTGDFDRVLQPGTYTITCAAPGYMPTTITGLNVDADASTLANCVMSPTGLRYASSSSGGDVCGSGGAGNGDGVIDAGEEATLQLTLTNPGSVAATGVSGTIATSYPGVTVTQSTASFSDVPGGGTGASVAPHFHVLVDPSIPCGTAIPFTIHMTSAQGAWDDTFSAMVGQTATGTTTTLLTESFDGTTFPPSGWAQADTSGTAGNWARSTNTVHPSGGGTHSGAGLAYFNSYTAGSGSQTRLYRTSGVAIPSGVASAAVSFWMYHDTNSSGTNDSIQVQASTNGTTWTNAGTAVSRYDGSTGWKQHTVSLSSYTGASSVRIAFLGISAFGYDCHIDEVTMTTTTPSTCTMHACAVPSWTDLAASASGPAQAAAGSTVAYTLGVNNNGPGSGTNVQLTSATPAGTTFVSLNAPPGWTCQTPPAGGSGAVSCSLSSLPAASQQSFTLGVKLPWCMGNGAAITAGVMVSTASTDQAVSNNAASSGTIVGDDGHCDDGNVCTTGDACSGNACQPGTGTLDCNDNNVCTTDTCNPSTGCVFTNNTVACDDGNACTTGDTCGGGTCQPGTGTLSCNDNNVCTTDTCNPTSGCVFTNNTVACDDGNACTTGDTCGGGTCQPGTGTLSCNDNNVCTTDTCNPTSGCVFTNNTAACDDGNPCTQSDVCQGGVCAGTLITAPGETSGLMAGSDKSTLEWSPLPGASSYDLARGSLATLPAGTGPGGSCFAGLASPVLDDPDVPAAGSGYWYLSRAVNACAKGTYGTQSDGTERNPATCP